MEFGANGPAGLSVPRLALIMLMMLDFDGDSVSATINLARETPRLPVVETLRSRSHATLCNAQVLQIHANPSENILLIESARSKSCAFFSKWWLVTVVAMVPVFIRMWLWRPNKGAAL